MSLRRRFEQPTAITQLMNDLNAGVRLDEMLMLGGGNPALIPAIQHELAALLQQQVANGSLLNAISHYDGPLGSDQFRELVATELQRHGWAVSAANIAITNGSQSAFFALFNLLAGSSSGRGKGQIVLPMVPEYVGYGDLAIEPNLFRAQLPQIIIEDNQRFRYQPNLDQLALGDDDALICLSHPANPTGHRFSDANLEQLRTQAQRHGIPLLLDLAYGAPFPAIEFNDDNANSHYQWQAGEIACLSLSKLGFPGVRSGIVVADPHIIELLSNFAGVAGLAPGSIGPALAAPLFSSQKLDYWCQQLIRPWYQQRQQLVINELLHLLPDERFRIHRSQGTFFLWLWFDEMGFNAEQRYQARKAAGVLVVPGHHFCPGLSQPWPHAAQCIRLSIALDDEQQLREAALRISKVVKQLAKS